MSALLAHAKAFRALSRSQQRVAEALVKQGDKGNALVLAAMADAHRLAADALEQQARDEATGNGPRDMADAPAADGRPE